MCILGRVTTIPDNYIIAWMISVQWDFGDVDWMCGLRKCGSFDII